VNSRLPLCPFDVEKKIYPLPLAIRVAFIPFPTSLGQPDQSWNGGSQVFNHPRFIETKLVGPNPLNVLHQTEHNEGDSLFSSNEVFSSTFINWSQHKSDSNLA